MPKITKPPVKSILPAKPTTVHAPPTNPALDKRDRPRVFECVVRIEHAIESLSKVGLSPNLETSEKRGRIEVELKSLLATYKQFYQEQLS